MEIYFIRHGQTEGNRLHIHQRPSSPLDAVGEAQAEAVAKKLTALKPTHLLTSPFFRTRQTADTIARATGLVPVVEPAFVEIVRPEAIHGEHYFSLASIRYLTRWFVSGNTYFRDEKRGESYRALLERIGQAKDILESYPADARIVVVSHAVFINFFIEHICSAKPISYLKAVARFLKITSIRNSSITYVVCEKSSTTKHTCSWSLVTFDDATHLPD
jgi:broad specificity phosphatase PhoE